MEKNINDIVSKNIQKYRKKLGITQIELAEKLNYSDKAISKWERGESIPDVSVLMQIANIFGITINDLCYESAVSEKEVLPTIRKINHLYISILSVGLCWLVATTVFVSFLIFAPNLQSKWLCFIYALPISGIVMLVFNTKWGKRIWNAVFVSIIIWGVLLSICLTIQDPKINWLFIVGVPLEILTIVWYFFKTKIIERFKALKIMQKNKSK